MNDQCAVCNGTGKLQISPELAGYQRTGRQTDDGRTIWRTPDQQLYLFAPGNEHVVVPCGRCLLREQVAQWGATKIASAARAAHTGWSVQEPGRGEPPLRPVIESLRAIYRSIELQIRMLEAYAYPPFIVEAKPREAK